VVVAKLTATPGLAWKRRGPQTPTYQWWNLHDKYGEATAFEAALSDAAASQRGSRSSRS
jgi:hypothetical protein